MELTGIISRTRNLEGEKKKYGKKEMLRKDHLKHLSKFIYNSDNYNRS
jgi:hypothetical protein